MLADNELIAVYNFARKFLPHRLQDTAINNIVYPVETPHFMAMYAKQTIEEEVAGLLVVEFRIHLLSMPVFKVSQHPQLREGGGRTCKGPRTNGKEFGIHFLKFAPL